MREELAKRGIGISYLIAKREQTRTVC
jgi:hypothetical protein